MDDRDVYFVWGGFQKTPIGKNGDSALNVIDGLMKNAVQMKTRSFVIFVGRSK